MYVCALLYRVAWCSVCTDWTIQEGDIQVHHIHPGQVSSSHCLQYKVCNLKSEFSPFKQLSRSYIIVLL